MKTSYYVEYWHNFSNTYNLWHAPSGWPVPEDWQRITRRRAERLAAAERRARKVDPAFSGYASAYVLPADAAEDDTCDIVAAAYDGRKYYFDGPGIIRRVPD